MEPHNTLVPFKPKESAAKFQRAHLDTALRVTVLTGDHDLAARLDRSFRLLRAEVTQVEKIEQAKELIDLGLSDATVVDVHGADGWPGVVFQLFDDRAKRQAVVILCNDAEDARHYQERSQHIIDIFPNSVVDDLRFRCVIQAAMLRVEAAEPNQNIDLLPVA